MNKIKKKPKSVSKDNLVQMSIFDSFNVWNNSQNIKKMRRNNPTVFSTVVIEIDSDTETSNDVDHVSSLEKRKLPFPLLSDEEDINEYIHVKQDPEDGSKGINKPTSQLMHPEACSTPLNLSKSNMNDTPIDCLNLSTILPGDTTIKKLNSVSDRGTPNSTIANQKTCTPNKTDSDSTTVICQKTVTPNRNIEKMQVLDQVIITPIHNKNDTNSSNIIKSQDKSKNNMEIPEKEIANKRVAKENAETPKRQKINRFDKEKKKHTCREVFNDTKDKMSPDISNCSTGNEILNNAMDWINLSKPSCSKSPEGSYIATENITNKKKIPNNFKFKGVSIERASENNYNFKNRKAITGNKLNYGKNVARCIDDIRISNSNSIMCSQPGPNTPEITNKPKGVLDNISTIINEVIKNQRDVKPPERRLIVKKTAMLTNCSNSQNKTNIISKTDAVSGKNGNLRSNRNRPSQATKTVTQTYCQPSCSNSPKKLRVEENQNNVHKKPNNQNEPVQVTNKIPNTSKKRNLLEVVNSLSKGKMPVNSMEKIQTSSMSSYQPNTTISPEKLTVKVVTEKIGNKNESIQSINILPSTSKEALLRNMENKQRNLNGTDSQASNSKSPVKTKFDKNTKSEAKVEGKKMNMRYITLIQELFNTVVGTNHLPDDDKKAIDIFRDMDPCYQYVCIKLFTWQWKWYNIFKFCEKIHLGIGDSQVHEMYTFFKENGIVDTEYTTESDDIGKQKLLELLNPNDVKSMRDTFKLKKTLNNKRDIIDNLLRICSTQSTLTQKSISDLLMQELEQKLGRAIKLKKSFHESFYRTYVLATFTNPAFSTISDYFRNILDLRLVFPEYPVEEKYCVFYSKDEFVRYATARKYQEELDKIIGKYHSESVELCKLIFEELKKTKDDEIGNEDRYRESSHLIRFTDKAVYVRALSNAADTLSTKFPEVVKLWLEYMIKEEEKYFSHRIGDWYFHLSWLYMKYLEPRNYTYAAKLIIEVLQKKREYLSEVQLQQLGMRGEALKATKKYKIRQLYHDIIIELSPAPINTNDIPVTVVDSTAIRSNVSGKKRNYFSRDKEGNKTILTVEDVALNYYIEKEGFTDGRHCEGSLIKATFTLFFWDIIYNAKDIIPGTFISKIQCEPLDIHTKYFYINRKGAIDKRLKEIESDWSDSQLINFVKDKYNKHSHESALCEVGIFIQNEALLDTLVECIGRRVLAKIYERWVKNIRQYRSGLPDLLVWNADKKTCKFVEVKGENDKLSVKQVLWLNYLKSIGAQIQLCQVHSTGSKRKKNDQKVTDRVPTESSPSSSSSSLSSSAN